MLNDAWFQLRSMLIEQWYLHGDWLIALAMIAAVAYLVYRWRDARA